MTATGQYIYDIQVLKLLSNFSNKQQPLL